MIDMARIRTIKPEFFTSDDIVSMTPLARLFYVSLWCEADREGRLAWNVRTLKMRYLPADDTDIDEVAGELIERGLVRLYEVDGKIYATIPTFELHQVINNKERASVLPSPSDEGSADVSFTRESGVQAEGKGMEGMEGNGRERNGRSRSGDAATAAKRPPKPSFDWDAGKIVGLPTAVVDKWQDAYPAIDVRTEIAKAEAWQIANPKNRKGDYVRFLNGWLSRSQDRAPRTGIAGSGTPISERNRIAREQHLQSRGSGSAWSSPGDDIVDMEPNQ